MKKEIFKKIILDLCKSSKNNVVPVNTLWVLPNVNILYNQSTFIKTKKLNF